MHIGADLSDMELRDLATRWINPYWASAAHLRSVTHLDGQSLVGGGGRKGDYSGIAIPYFPPGSDQEVTWRLRRRNPEIDARTRKAKNKYLSPPREHSHLYFPPLTSTEDLKTTNLPILIVEGEFKALAMRRLASAHGDLKQFLPIAVSGVWNWRGVIGHQGNENGVQVPVKGVIPDLDQINWVNRNVIIAFDSDRGPRVEVRRARHSLSVELRSRGANVGYLEWDPEEGKGPDDWLATVGSDYVLAAIARVEFNTSTGWEAKLLCTATGKPKSVVENVRLALENTPEFASLALDEFSERIARPVTAPWPGHIGDWSDTDSIELSAWMQRKHIDVGKETAFDAVQIVAKRNGFHPVRNYLKSLVWDGEPRVDGWLTKYVGAKQNEYSTMVGRCWLISAVARILSPGCKADSALLLIGGEGVGKSSVCRILGEPWFSDNLPDLSEKDAALHLNGHWILELGELAALNKAALTTVKSWMSRSEDIYRPPYGRMSVRRLRQCVFIATSNDAEPLKDTSGNRRFWPITVGLIDTAGLAVDRDQLWAEAVALYESGASWYLTEKRNIQDAEREQASRTEQHVWLNPVRKYCQDLERVTVTEVLSGAVHKDIAHQTQADKLGVVRCLLTLGWQMRMRRVQGTQTKFYVNPEMLPDTSVDDEEI